MHRIAVPIVIFGCLLAAVRIARSETYSTTGAWLSNHSTETLDAAFDFGIAFSRIDSVRVEVKNDQGSFPAFCTGSYCSVSTLVVDVTEIGDTSRFKTHQDITDQGYPSMYGEFQGVLPYPWMRAGISRPGEWLVVQDKDYEPATWPNFLMSGSGKMRLSVVTSVGCMLNCASIKSGIGLSPPEGLTDLRIVVDGIAAPEPSTTASLLLGMMIAVGSRRRLRCDVGHRSLK